MLGSMWASNPTFVNTGERILPLRHKRFVEVATPTMRWLKFVGAIHESPASFRKLTKKIRGISSDLAFRGVFYCVGRGLAPAVFFSQPMPQ